MHYTHLNPQKVLLYFQCSNKLTGEWKVENANKYVCLHIFWFFISLYSQKDISKNTCKFTERDTGKHESWSKNFSASYVILKGKWTWVLTISHDFVSCHLEIVHNTIFVVYDINKGDYYNVLHVPTSLKISKFWPMLK